MAVRPHEGICGYTTIVYIYIYIYTKLHCLNALVCAFNFFLVFVPMLPNFIMPLLLLRKFVRLFPDQSVNLGRHLRITFCPDSCFD